MLAAIPVMSDERLLVGLEAPDDAAVYRLGDGRVVAASVDYFTPLVDGAEDFGAIAAANAFSDLYAMGVRPAFALSLLGIPAGELPDAVVEGIFRGATDVCREAGAVIAGGHSIDDPEPKFGLVAIGLAAEEELFRLGAGSPGEVLLLGKALGTGVITTGIKHEKARAEWADAAVASMRRLNDAALDTVRDAAPGAVTDVSGFGLLGHLGELCRASGVSARVDARAPVLLPGARELAANGSVPGGTRRNRKAVEALVAWDADVDEPLRTLLCDAQTSGGLLASVAPERADRVLDGWREAGYAAARIGELEPAEGESGIRVTGS